MVDIDALNASQQLCHGKKLLTSVRQRKAELMEAIIPFRTSHLLQCMSWPELDYSYGLRLKDIIHRTVFARCDNWIGYVDSDITLMIVEIGRSFTETEAANRPNNFLKGHDAGAIGSHASGVWPEHIRESHALEELRRKDWRGDNVGRLLVTNKVEYKTDHEAEIRCIPETICSMKGLRHPSQNFQVSIGREERDDFIIDFLTTRFACAPDYRLEQVAGESLNANDLNIMSLTALGGLTIVWTDIIDDHLRLSPSSRTICLFWNVPLLEQSLLFRYNAQCLKGPS